MRTFDPQGSVAQRLNSSGSVLSSPMFDAYGLELSTPASTEPWGFGAQWGGTADRESGLVLLGHRYSDPHIARFVTPPRREEPNAALPLDFGAGGRPPAGASRPYPAGIKKSGFLSPWAALARLERFREERRKQQGDARGPAPDGP